MKTVQQLLMQMDIALWYVKPEATVFEALKLMSEAGIGAVLVMENGRMVGIFSERDYARKVALEGRDSRTTTVNEIMTHDVLCVSPETATEECMGIMVSKRIRHLPVVKDSEVIGMISIRDLMADIIVEREIIIKQLESYIYS
jgi:CBS domain-containing protein